MKLMYLAGAVLVVFIAIWFFVVVPAERKHHERKLASLRKKIEQRETQKVEDQKYEPPDPE